MQPNYRIFINKAGDGYTVTVNPVPHGDSFAKGFAAHPEAFGYAGGLRLVHRWPVVDLTAGHLNSLLGLEGGAA